MEKYSEKALKTCIRIMASSTSSSSLSSSLLPGDSITSSLHPCSIESLRDNENQTIIACGCYELHGKDSSDNEASRAGEILLISFNNDDNQKLTVKSRIECPAGVLDMKFDGRYLSAALSNESFVMYHTEDLLRSIENGSDTSMAVQMMPVMVGCKAGEGLFTSLDLVYTSTQHHSVAVSTQEGAIAIFVNDNSGDMVEVIHMPEAHKHRHLGKVPVWITAWSHDGSLLLSGGDDCNLKIWDIRLPFRSSESAIITRSVDQLHADSTQATYYNTCSNGRTHTAGVTSAQWYGADRPCTVMTGSYDELLCIWDIRHISSPLCSIATGGGVWRAKLSRTTKR